LEISLGCCGRDLVCGLAGWLGTGSLFGLDCEEVGELPPSLGMVKPPVGTGLLLSEEEGGEVSWSEEGKLVGFSFLVSLTSSVEKVKLFSEGEEE